MWFEALRKFFLKQCHYKWKILSAGDHKTQNKNVKAAKGLEALALKSDFSFGGHPSGISYTVNRQVPISHYTAKLLYYKLVQVEFNTTTLWNISIRISFQRLSWVNKRVINRFPRVKAKIESCVVPGTSYFKFGSPNQIKYIVSLSSVSLTLYILYNHFASTGLNYLLDMSSSSTFSCEMTSHSAGWKSGARGDHRNQFSVRQLPIRSRSKPHQCS